MTLATQTNLPHIDWAAAAATLRDDGVVHLPNALSPTALAEITTLVTASIDSNRAAMRRFYPKEQATFLEGHAGEGAKPDYLAVIRRSGIRGVVERLWSESRFWYLGAQLFLKEGGQSRRTPWHQDTSYLRMRGEQLIAVWTSLDPLPREHCLEFVRGSHRGTLFNGSAFAEDDDTRPLYRDSPLPRLPDIQANRDGHDIVAYDIAPGDLVVFHLGTMHGGAGTAPGMRRRTASLRFLGPDVVYDGRVRDHRDAKEGNDAALAGIYAGLRDGDPFPTAHLELV